jgi:hypothetical protein
MSWTHPGQTTINSEFAFLGAFSKQNMLTTTIIVLRMFKMDATLPIDDGWGLQFVSKTKPI